MDVHLNMNHPSDKWEYVVTIYNKRGKPKCGRIFAYEDRKDAKKLVRKLRRKLKGTKTWSEMYPIINKYNW